MTTYAAPTVCTVPDCNQFALRSGGNCSAHKHAVVRDYATPNASPPFAVRRMLNGPTHIVARDGFTIIATVNHDEGEVAEKLAASPDMAAALQALVRVDMGYGKLGPAIDLARAALKKAGVL